MSAQRPISSYPLAASLSRADACKQELSRMSNRDPMSILAAVTCEDTLYEIDQLAMYSFDSCVTHASTGSEAIELDFLQSHRVVIVEAGLPDMDGCELVRQLLDIRHRPAVLIGDGCDSRLLMSALKLRVADFVDSPASPRTLRDAINRAVRDSGTMGRRVRREQRLRGMMRRLLRERRGLQRRMDLLCNDLVGAQRQLFHRVLTMQSGQDSF